mgnify:FL=1
MTLNLAIVDTETGETIEAQTETEYYSTLAEAEQAAAQYREAGIAGEYTDGIIAAVTSADVDPEPQEVELF